MNRQKRLEAAARVEELAAIAKQMVLDLRGPEDPQGQVEANDTAYARVYWLRHALGRVVADLGVGNPPTWAKRQVEREYGEEAGWSTDLNVK